MLGIVFGWKGFNTIFYTLIEQGYKVVLVYYGNICTIGCDNIKSNYNRLLKKYDKDRNLTNETIYKGEIIPNNRYILVVLVFMENVNNEFLMQQRVDKKCGLFASTGGHPKSKESSLEGIITEINEEIGLKFNSNDLKLYYSGKDNINRVFYDYYYAKINNVDIKNLIIQKDEVESVCYLTKEEIINLINNYMFFKKHILGFEKLLEWLDDNNE